MTAKEKFQVLRRLVLETPLDKQNIRELENKFDIHADDIEQALTELEELKNDVKRYFELRSLPDDEYTTEVSRECVRLELKLWKVGNEE